jgi:DNA (cytosine-5)-methyltransferase 1
VRSIELFTGCGGLALGLSRAGYTADRLVERDSCAVATVEHNRDAGIEHVRNWPIIKADVRSVDWKPYAGVDLVAGGPPCQPFSIGGKAGGEFDERDMWPQAVRAVREMAPRGFLFENVRGLLRLKFTGYLAKIVINLSQPGAGLEYIPRVELVNAADYGAPQKRHRVIIGGVRSDQGTELGELSPTHSRERLLWDQWITGDYWRQHGLKKPHGPPKIDAATVKKLKSLETAPTLLRWVTVRDALKGLGEPNGIRNHTFQPGARSYAGHTGSPLDQPAKALKAGDHGVPGGENMMVCDDGTVRYFTIREAARLQGLPDDYEFPRSWTESMRQLGNAVPSQLGCAAGTWLRTALDSAKPGTISIAA